MNFFFDYLKNKFFLIKFLQIFEIFLILANKFWLYLLYIAKPYKVKFEQIEIFKILR